MAAHLQLTILVSLLMKKLFIEISKDVAEYLRENQKADDNIRIAIETLFICMLKKKHIVFADRQAVQCLLKANMSLSATCALKWIEKSYYDLYALKNKIGRRILLIMGQRLWQLHRHFSSNSHHHLLLEQI